MVLADSAFGRIEFLKGVRQLGLHTLVGASKRRCLQDGRCLNHLAHHGSQVKLKGWDQWVWVAWYWLRQSDGRVLKRFVLCTRRLKGSTLLWWGKRRWQIEGWFKVAKHRFGLDRFGQSTQLGVYRWLVLSFIAFVLAMWGCLLLEMTTIPDWGEAAAAALEHFFPLVALTILVHDIERLRPLARQHGLDIQICCCKI